MESEQGARVIEIPLDRELTDDEADGYADKLSAYPFLQKVLKILILKFLTDAEQDLTEETYDGDDFFEEYGVMWFNEDDEDLDEAEYRGRKVKLGKSMRGDV